MNSGEIQSHAEEIAVVNESFITLQSPISRFMSSFEASLTPTGHTFIVITAGAIYE